MMASKDWKELRDREKTLNELKKKNLHDRELNQERQQNFRDNRKRKLDALDENTRKMITGKSAAAPGAPKRTDDTALIETISRMAISGSAADDRRRDTDCKNL